MTTQMDNALEFMNARYTKTAVESVLNDLTDLYEASLEAKAAMNASAVSQYAGPLSAPFDIESPSKIITESESLITIKGLAKLYKAINSLHLVMDQQNKIINPDREPVSPVDELRRQVAEAAKGNVPVSVTQTVSQYKLVSTPAADNSPDTSAAFPLVPLDKNSSPATLKMLHDTAVELESSNPMAVNVTSPEPSGALPKVVPIHDGPAPPKNNLELLESAESPLCEIFAPSPWFHEGRGVVTVGSKDFGYYKDVYPENKDAGTRAQLPNGFYGNDGNGRPISVLLRMKTSILIWGFGLDVEDMEVYIVGLSDTKPGEEPRWFKVSSLAASYTSRLVNDLNAYLREMSN